MRIVSINLEENQRVVITTETKHQIIIPTSAKDRIKTIPYDGYFYVKELREISELINGFAGWSIGSDTAIVLSDEYDPGSYMALDTNDKSQLVIFVPSDTVVEGFPIARIARVARGGGDVWVEVIK